MQGAPNQRPAHHHGDPRGLTRIAAQGMLGRFDRLLIACTACPSSLNVGFHVMEVELLTAIRQPPAGGQHRAITRQHRLRAAVRHWGLGAQSAARFHKTGERELAGRFWLYCTALLKGRATASAA